MDFKKVFIKHISDPLFLWNWGDYGMFRSARELEGSQFFSTEELQALQLERLRRLLEHAYRRCPFYHEQFQALGLSPNDIQSLADLRFLPVLEKRDIQEHFELMVAAGWPRKDLILDHTGGSTGAPIAFYQNRERKRSRTATVRRHNAWAGWETGDRVAYVWAHLATCPRPGGSPGWSPR